jgi:hypothetical protein
VAQGILIACSAAWICLFDSFQASKQRLRCLVLPGLKDKIFNNGRIRSLKNYFYSDNFATPMKFLDEVGVQRQCLFTAMLCYECMNSIFFRWIVTKIFLRTRYELN